jgi:hypothetical protein
MAAPGTDPDARIAALEGEGRAATEAPAELHGARAPTVPVHTCHSARNPASSPIKTI